MWLKSDITSTEPERLQYCSHQTLSASITHRVRSARDIHLNMTPRRDLPSPEHSSPPHHHNGSSVKWSAPASRWGKCPDLIIIKGSHSSRQSRRQDVSWTLSFADCNPMTKQRHFECCIMGASWLCDTRLSARGGVDRNDGKFSK